MAGNYECFSRYVEQGARVFNEHSTLLPDVNCSTWLAARGKSRLGQHGME
jgi:hypothetical protein